MITRIINLKLVYAATCGYENEYGHQRNYKPISPTFLGSVAHPKRPAKDHDTWRAFATFKFSNGRSETFYDRRAIDLWRAYAADQFSGNVKASPVRADQKDAAAIESGQDSTTPVGQFTFQF